MHAIWKIVLNHPIVIGKGVQDLKSSFFLDRKLPIIEGIYRYVSLPSSEYKLQCVKVCVIF